MVHQLLKKQRNVKGYSQSSLVLNPLTHNCHSLECILYREHFGVKYTGKEHANNSMVILYLGMDNNWDYSNHEVDLSMLSYAQNALKCFHRDRQWKKLVSSALK